MSSKHLILCRPLLLLPSIFPSIRVSSNESALRIRWPKDWSFHFSISCSRSTMSEFGVGGRNLYSQQVYQITCCRWSWDWHLNERISPLNGGPHLCFFIMMPLRDQDTVWNISASETTFQGCSPLSTSSRVSPAGPHVQGCCCCWGLLPALAPERSSAWVLDPGKGCTAGVRGEAPGAWHGLNLWAQPWPGPASATAGDSPEHLLCSWTDEALGAFLAPVPGPGASAWQLFLTVKELRPHLHWENGIPCSASQPGFAFSLKKKEFWPPII